MQEAGAGYKRAVRHTTWFVDAGENNSQTVSHQAWHCWGGLDDFMYVPEIFFLQDLHKEVDVNRSGSELFVHVHNLPSSI